MNYELKYPDWLNKARVDLSELPQELINLIAQFNKTHEQWTEAKEQEQKIFYKVLELTDAHISACIYRLFKDKIELIKKEKLAALKAKAAQLKLNTP